MQLYYKICIDIQFKFYKGIDVYSNKNIFILKNNSIVMMNS